jgi:aspartate kinase
MSGETNRLLGLAHEVTAGPRRARDGRHRGDRRAGRAALTAMAIQAEGGKARSLLGHQVKILTDDAFTKARIKAIEGSKIFETLDRGEIAVVAGFQGVDEQRQHHDARARRVGHERGRRRRGHRRDECEIYTDVDGVYTTDPNVCPSARKIDRISYEEMLELASLGAKVLQIRSVEIAMKYGVPVHVRSSFSTRRAPG